MNIKKVRCFTDVVHGTIQYSGLEDAIISTPLFNRLHRVLQNSLVYLTFPSNKTKRFEHSIGVMHLAGQIFHYSILNSNDECIAAFFEEIKKEINIWHKSIDQREYLYIDKKYQLAHSPDGQKDVGENISSFTVPDSKLYKKNIPANVITYRYLFVIMWQAIRIVGLLHDVGHLPYSHILEKSLQHLYVDINSIKPDEQNSRQLEFIKVLSPYFNANDKIEIHEQVGNQIFSIIEASIEHELTYGEALQNIEDQCIVALSFYFAKKIMNSKPDENNIFSDLHAIVASNYDADRMDYCSRDYCATGVRKDVLNYERIINSFTLGQVEYPLDLLESVHNNNKTRKRFIFAPLAKMTGEIENVLLRRFNIFKDINYHHNVHKTELIMIECIRYVGYDYLKGTENQSILHQGANQYILPIGIQGLWDSLLKMIEEKDSQVLQYYLIQMDDSWLDTTLKHVFMTKFKDPFDMYKNYANKEWHRLNELISAKKSYISIIKRADDFIDFDKEFFETIKTHAQTQTICKLCKRLNRGYSNSNVLTADTNIKNKIPSNLLAIFHQVVNSDYLTYFIETQKFFFNNLSAIVTDILGDINYFDRIKSDIEKYVVQECKVIDFILGQIRYSIGLSAETPIYVCKHIKCDGKIVNKFIHLNEISNLKHQLDVKYSERPFFHAYICPNRRNNGREIIPIDKRKIIKVLAKGMGDKIVNEIITYLNTMEQAFSGK